MNGKFNPKINKSRQGLPLFLDTYLCNILWANPISCSLCLAKILKIHTSLRSLSAPFIVILRLFRSIFWIFDFILAVPHRFCGSSSIYWNFYFSPSTSAESSHWNFLSMNWLTLPSDFCPIDAVYFEFLLCQMMLVFQS